MIIITRLLAKFILYLLIKFNASVSLSLYLPNISLAVNFFLNKLLKFFSIDLPERCPSILCEKSNLLL